MCVQCDNTSYIMLLPAHLAQNQHHPRIAQWLWSKREYFGTQTTNHFGLDSLSKKHLPLHQLFSLPYFLTFFLLLFLIIFNHGGSRNRYISYLVSDSTNKGEKYCWEFVNRTGEERVLLVHKSWKTTKVTTIICKTNLKTNNCMNLPLNRFSPLGCQFSVFWN